MEQKIRDLRLCLELSMTEFGHRVGYSSTHIARLEQGSSKPKQEFIEKMCEIFGVDIEYFTGNLILEDALTNALTDMAADDHDSEAENEQEYDGKAPERIKAIREDRGLSQRAFANIVGVNNSLVSEVEAGNRELSTTAAKKISNAFGVGYEWLLYGNEEKKDYPVNDRIIEWLWDNEDVRKELWKQMEKA